MGRKGRQKPHRRLQERSAARGVGTRSIWRDVRSGAAYGAGFGLFCLAIGGIRIAIVVLSGRSMDFRGFAFDVGYYFLGFVAAGTLLGLLWPFRRSRTTRLLVALVSASLAGFTMCVGFFGSISRWDGAEWFSCILTSMFMGFVLAHYIDPKRVASII